MSINVFSEIGKLKRLLVHSPDGGIGSVPTSKLHDWLYDDIVDIDKIQEEYSRYQILLLLFLDSSKLYDKTGSFALDKNSKKSVRDGETGIKAFENNPEKKGYYIDDNKINEEAVLDTQYLLQYLFKTYPDKAAFLIESICAIEGVHPFRKRDLLELLAAGKNNADYYSHIVKAILTGKLEHQFKNGVIIRLEGEDARYIFPPVPNFIFTRDIGVTIGNYLLITKPKFYIRKREVVLMRFIAENFIFKEDKEQFKILSVSEDDDFFQIEEKDQHTREVTYEGGDVMMISPKHLMIGCTERTSPYAIQKLINRIFWEDTGIEMISVIKISAKRSQMHIDTVLSHIREDLWVIHSPLSEVWQTKQDAKYWKEKLYLNKLNQQSSSENERQQEVTIFQFYLNEEGLKLKKEYDVEKEKRNDANLTEEQLAEIGLKKRDLKGKFKKLDFLLHQENSKVHHPLYTTAPKGLEDLLQQISKNDFGVTGKVDFVYSGAGDPPYDEREQWTDACNLLILKSGVAVGYDRNSRTANHFNEKMLETNSSVSNYPQFVDFIVAANKIRFEFRKNTRNEEMDLKHILHVEDLYDFILGKRYTNNVFTNDTAILSKPETDALINSIQNTLILLPSNELSRARGGSHCMSMPLLRD